MSGIQRVRSHSKLSPQHEKIRKVKERGTKNEI